MVQKRSIKTADVRTNKYMSLSDKAKVLLLDLKTNASDSYGFIVDTGMSLLATSHGGKDLEQCQQALDELIEEKYLYDFGNGIYLIMDWQRDNAIDYQKTTQPTAPELLTYIYASDNDNRYHLSALPIRSTRGWSGKILTKNGTVNRNAHDNVPSRQFIFESGIEPDYQNKVVPFDMSLPWSEHEKVAKDYLVSQGINPETGEIKKEEAPNLASSTSFTSDNELEQDEVKVNPYLQVGASSDTESVSDDLPF